MPETEIPSDAVEAMALLKAEGWPLEWRKFRNFSELGIFGATESEEVDSFLPTAHKITLYQGVLFLIYPHEGRYEWEVPGCQGPAFATGPADSFVDGARKVIVAVKEFQELIQKHRPKRPRV